MADQMKNMMIGIFIMAAILILVFVILFLHPYVGNRGKVIHAIFSNIDKVNVGTRVNYAGKPVGDVVEIKEVEFGRAGPVDSQGRVYLYELALRVDSSVNVYNTDEISLRTSGLLGEKNVEITPYAPKPGQVLVQIDNEVIIAKETETIEDTLKQIREIGVKVERALDGITDVVEEVKEYKLISKVTRIAENVGDITKALDKPKELSEFIDHIHTLSVKANKSWEKVDLALDDLKETLTHTNKISGTIVQGKGTIGKLVIDEGLYLQLNSLIGKAETIFDDINHYGLLYHTDKGWQRLRARRMNLLQKLCSPQEFRNYFNDEIDQISTSISRVGMVLEKDNCNPCCCDLMLDKEFKKVFSELLRRIKTIEEELRMYNIQVVDNHVHETELRNY